MSAGDDLQRLGLAVGTVRAVSEHAGSRAPAYLLTIDLGAQGDVQASVPRAGYERDELEGRQVVVARDGDEVLVLAARSHAGRAVLLRPDRDVEDGTLVA